jgi:hypothetical protein
MKPILIIVIAVVFVACKNNSNKQDNQYTLSDDYMIEKDTGLIVALEDIGYPMFALDLKIAGSGGMKSYLLNIEAIDLSHDEAYKLKDKNAVVSYTRRQEPFVLDIEYQQLSILGEWAPENHVGCNSIIGVLSGADEESQGDLPGSFKVTTDDTTTHMTFEYYIDESLTKVNGDTVEVYYEYRNVQHINSIKVSD